MKNFSELKVYSELAWAAYADYNGDITEHYKELKYQLNTDNGFSAKFYENKDTNELVVSIRGTETREGLEELYHDLVVADGNLALNHIPSGQAVDTINFINGIKSTLQEAKESGKKVTVIGHSLGGTLAQIAAKSFPGLFDECYTFNSPSAKTLFDYKIYKDANEEYFYIGNEQVNFTHYLDKQIGEALYNFQNQNMKTRTTNVAAKDDPRIINNLWWNDRFGALLEVSGDSHSITDLTQILYFYDFAIENGASENEVTNYLSKMYESQSPLSGSVAGIATQTVQGINKIVGKSSASELIDILKDYDGANMKLDLITKDNVSSHFSASSSIAELYALAHLNPFIVSGVKSSAYDEIERYKDDFTAGYIADKAKMMQALFNPSKHLGTSFLDLYSGKSIDLSEDFNGIYDEMIFGSNGGDKILKCA